MRENAALLMWAFVGALVLGCVVIAGGLVLAGEQLLEVVGKALGG